MKLYSPDGVKVNVDKEQEATMLAAGWTKTPPKKEEAVKASDENPEASAEVKEETPAEAPVKPAPISRKKRITKTEE